MVDFSILEPGEQLEPSPTPASEDDKPAFDNNVETASAIAVRVFSTTKGAENGGEASERNRPFAHRCKHCGKLHTLLLPRISRTHRGAGVRDSRGVPFTFQCAGIHTSVERLLPLLLVEIHTMDRQLHIREVLLLGLHPHSHDHVEPRAL